MYMKNVPSSCMCVYTCTYIIYMYTHVYLYHMYLRVLVNRATRVCAHTVFIHCGCVHKDVLTTDTVCYTPVLCTHHLLDMYSSVCATGLGKPHTRVRTYVANVHTVNVVCQHEFFILHLSNILSNLQYFCLFFQ
jgi:hypothetical protein